MPAGAAWEFVLPASPISSTPPITSPSVSNRAKPLFFVSGDRPLYGVYHPPLEARPDAPAVIHCHTLGVEQLTSYRVEALGARAAAAAGCPAFRYHSRGHGDSAGDFQAVTFESLVEDCLAAADEARRLSGARRVVWLGVRFGALVAAEALRRRSGAGLILWEPAHKSQDYFRSMLRSLLFSQVVKGERPSTTVDQLLERLEREGAIDVHGYYLHRALYTTARVADLDRALEDWSGPTFLAQIQARPGMAPAHSVLASALEKRRARVTTAQINEEPGWHFLANPAWESAALVRRTAEWLDALD